MSKFLIVPKKIKPLGSWDCKKFDPRQFITGHSRQGVTQSMLANNSVDGEIDAHKRQQVGSKGRYILKFNRSIKYSKSHYSVYCFSLI